MEKGDSLKHAFLNSALVAIYIVLVVLFISSLNGSVIDGKKESLITPIFMLMFFVFSAAFTGFLVFGKPIMLYLDGKKREALSLLSYTLGIFLVITIVVFLFLILFSI